MEELNQKILEIVPANVEDDCEEKCKSSYFLKTFFEVRMVVELIFPTFFSICQQINKVLSPYKHNFIDFYAQVTWTTIVKRNKSIFPII